MTTIAPTMLFRSVEAVTEVNPKKGLVRAIISDDSTDRYKTIFDPRGADWSGFMNAGGPVDVDHGKSARGNLPVGNVVSLERGSFKGRQSIIADTRFWDTDDFAKTIKSAYESMRMKGWSISALAGNQSPPTPTEKRARPDWNEAHTVYRSWELLTLSVCSTPGNANTLTTEVLRSMYGTRTNTSSVFTERSLASIRHGLRTNPAAARATLEEHTNKMILAIYRRSGSAAARQAARAIRDEVARLERGL
jgi:hypothetical protein